MRFPAPRAARIAVHAHSFREPARRNPPGIAGRAATMRLKFTKMQGAGNDFIVIDATRGPVDLGAQAIRRLADRHFGVGFDQMLLVESPRSPATDEITPMQPFFCASKWFPRIVISEM